MVVSLEAVKKIVEGISRIIEVTNTTKEATETGVGIAEEVQKTKVEQFKENMSQRWDAFKDNHPTISGAMEAVGSGLSTAVSTLTSKTGGRGLKLLGAGLAAAAMAGPAGPVVAAGIVVGAAVAVTVGVIMDTNKAIRLDNLKEERADLEQLHEVQKGRDALCKGLDQSLAQDLGIKPRAEAHAPAETHEEAASSSLAPQGGLRSALKSFRDRFGEDAFALGIAAATGDVAGIAITAVGTAIGQVAGVVERREADEKKKELREDIAHLREECPDAAKDKYALKRQVREETVEKDALDRLTKDETVRPLLEKGADRTKEETAQLKEKFDTYKAEASEKLPEVKEPSRWQRFTSYMQKMGQVVKEQCGKLFSKEEEHEKGGVAAEAGHGVGHARQAEPEVGHGKEKSGAEVTAAAEIRIEARAEVRAEARETSAPASSAEQQSSHAEQRHNPQLRETVEVMIAQAESRGGSREEVLKTIRSTVHEFEVDGASKATSAQAGQAKTGEVAMTAETAAKHHETAKGA